MAQVLARLGQNDGHRIHKTLRHHVAKQPAGTQSAFRRFQRDDVSDAGGETGLPLKPVGCGERSRRVARRAWVGIHWDCQYLGYNTYIQVKLRGN